MSLLEYDTTWKRWVDKTTFKLKVKNNGTGEEYEFKAIGDNTVYAREL